MGALTADWFVQAVTDARAAGARAHRAKVAIIRGNVMPDGTPITEDTIGALMSEHYAELFAEYGDDATDSVG